LLGFKIVENEIASLLFFKDYRGGHIFYSEALKGRNTLAMGAAHRTGDYLSFQAL